MTWDKTKPTTSSTLRVSNPEILANFAAVETQLGHGHNFPTNGGHSEGSAVCYYEDSAPTTKQDGSTALDANDNGSLWIDSNATPKIFYHYVHPSWVATGTIMSLLDEDDMSSDDATLAPTQQSVKAYADSVVTQVLTAKTTSYTVGADSSAAVECNGHYIFTNNGSSGTVLFTLPAGAANYKVSFICQTAQALRIIPDGSEVFVDFTHSSTAAKYISTSTVGTTITIAWDGAKWQIMEQIGVWDEQT